MQITNREEVILATGSVTREPPNSKSIVKIFGQGEMWTLSPRLANLNGAKWTCGGRAISEREVRSALLTFLRRSRQNTLAK